MKKVRFSIKIIIICVLLIFIIAIGVFYCSAHIKVQNDQDNKVKDSIVYSVHNINKNLNIRACEDYNTRNIIAITSRGLVKKDNNGNVIKDLASNYEVNENGIEYDFKIDSDSSWSNGQKITAEDYSDFFKNLILNEDEKDIEGLFCIYGVSDYKNNKCTFQDTGITCSQDILKIRLNYKNDNFINELTKIQYRLRSNTTLWSDIFSNYNKIKYSGNYYISQADQDQLILKQVKSSNDNILNTIVFKCDETKELAMAQFEIGERDIINDPPKDYLESLNGEDKLISRLSNDSMVAQFNASKDTLSLGQRKAVFKLLYEAVEKYYRDHMYYIEPSEGAYTDEEKNNISLIQSRKVIINNSKEALDDIKKDKISLIVEDTAENRFWVQYFKDYFKENSNLNISETFVDSDEINDDELKKRFDLVFYKTDNSNFNKAEESNEETFNNCIIRNLFFFNNNIAISKYAGNINFDWYGDISL